MSFHCDNCGGLKDGKITISDNEDITIIGSSRVHIQSCNEVVVNGCLDVRLDNSNAEVRSSMIRTNKCIIELDMDNCVRGRN